MKGLLRLNELNVGFHASGEKPISLFPPVNIALESGDFIALMGPNGAGKTTLLRTITGMHKPLSGEILLRGKNYNDYSQIEIARLVSIVLTDRISDFYLTVKEVVAMGRYPYTGFWGKLSKNDFQLVEAGIDASGIGGLANRTMISLSDGEKQKVMIAKALAQDTPIIILDEPAAFLDYPSKIELMFLLRSLAHKQNKTILFSTHDLELAINAADKIWLLGRDMPLVEGIPEQLVVDGFVGKYFNRDKLLFDQNEGRFIFHLPGNIQIGLQGEGPKRIWVRHALIRNGFAVVDGLNNGNYIIVGEKGYTCCFSDKACIFTDRIEEILLHYETYFNQDDKAR